MTETRETLTLRVVNRVFKNSTALKLLLSVGKWTAYVFLSAAVMAEEPVGYDYLELARRNPTGFGFQNADDVEGAKRGISYPLYTKTEWRTEVANSSDIDTEKAPRQLSEIVGTDNLPRCVLFRELTASGDYRDGFFGYSNLVDEMLLLRTLKDPQKAVLIIDEQSRQLFFAEIQEPEKIRKFSELEERKTPEPSKKPEIQEP